MREFPEQHRLLVAILCTTAFITGCEKAAPPPTESAMCGIDLINGVPKDQAGKVKRGTINVSGWAFEGQKSAVPADVTIELQMIGGKEKLSGMAGRTKRPDVAKAFGSTALEGAGFDGAIDAKNAASGRYVIHVVQKSGSKASSCDPKVALDVE